jgi:1-deoxy-D-xylulose 5-phosphate reductoisomerase
MSGTTALSEAVSGSGTDIVLAAMVVSGLLPTIAAINSRKDIARPTKKPGGAGALITSRPEERIGHLSVDSEHSAIFRACRRRSRKG